MYKGAGAARDAQAGRVSSVMRWVPGGTFRMGADHAYPEYDRAQPEIRIPRKVIKGSSYFCAPNGCRRYRQAARHPQMIDTSTCHTGFRCVIRASKAVPQRCALP